VDVAAGTIVVWSDIGCPWAHRAVYRLHVTRTRLGLDDAVLFEHRPFPLELFNARPTPRPVLGSEVPVLGSLDPDAGWQVWQAPGWHWPVTTLPALEAVQAAYEQGGRAAERLDRALRVAFFGQSRCISLVPVILEVADECTGVDASAIEAVLGAGRARRAVLDRYHEATASGEVEGSPHVFVADGTSAHNPGVAMRMTGPEGVGFPVIERDDPSVYGDLLRRAAK
jgi:predicted DsbA family dithiol-disulfide isomerase